MTTMKNKMLRLIALSLICVMILCTLPSCSKSMALLSMPEEARANQFFILVNMITDNSYTVEMSQEMSGSVYGVNFKAEMTGISEYSGYGTKNYVEYNEMYQKLEMGYGETLSVTETDLLAGFYDGQMYYSSESGTTVSRLFSKLTADEYIQYEAKLSDVDGQELISAIQDCTTKTCSRLEDKTWIATYTDFTEEGMEAVLENFDPTVTVVDGYKTVDATIEVTADKNVDLTSITYTLIFEKSDEKNVYPEAKAKTSMKFSNFGSTEATKPDLGDFSEVDDLRVMQLAKRALNDFLDTDSGAFELNDTQTITFGSENNKSVTKSKCSFECEDGKYCFDINIQSNANTTDITIDFADGILTVKQGKDTQQRDEVSDHEAKVIVQKLIDPIDFLSAEFSDIEVIDASAGEYKFTPINPNINSFESYLEAFEAADIISRTDITVIFKDEQIQKITYNITITSKVDGIAFNIKSTCEVTFPQAVDDEII